MARSRHEGQFHKNNVESRHLDEWTVRTFKRRQMACGTKIRQSSAEEVTVSSRFSKPVFLTSNRFAVKYLRDIFPSFFFTSYLRLNNQSG